MEEVFYQTREKTNTGHWSQQTETQHREVKRVPRTPRSQQAECREQPGHVRAGTLGRVSTGKGGEPSVDVSTQTVRTDKSRDG